jgi:hypothetical protein
MHSFAFFAERIESRPHYREQALRCGLLCASIACIALDTALERVVFEEASIRYKAIADGVTYGDSGDGRIQKSIGDVLALIGESMENGRIVASQAKEHIDRRFGAVRADVVAEYFSREHNAGQLVAIARELEGAAHLCSAPQPALLSTDARALLGVIADFVQVRRHAIIGAAQAVSAESQSVEGIGDASQKQAGKLL